MEKIDFKKADKAFYTGKVGRYDTLTIPAMQFLMIDGMGDPGTSPGYAASVAALFGLAYGLKFHCKTALERDHVVGPFEALWWADDMQVYITGEKDLWKWSLCLRQPEYVTQDMLDIVLQAVIVKNAKKKDAPTDTAHLQAVRLETRIEGLSVQILHVGSYADEAPVLAKMHSEVIPELGLKMHGLHHEIYLNDPRRVAPEKLRTILRQPVQKQ